MNRQGMTAPFAEEELLTFEGRGGKAMTYIQDETVMDRLDLGYGPGNWAVHVEPISVADGIVKVRLGIRETDGPLSEWTWYEDFGYQNQSGGQGLKEAVSDGIRRCGRYVGIARDLYRKDNTGGAARPVRNAPQRPPAAPVAARPHLVDTDIMDPDEEDVDALFAEATTRADLTSCPIHAVKWAGTPGDLFHKTPDGKWCRHPDNVQKARAR